MYKERGFSVRELIFISNPFECMPQIDKVEIEKEKRKKCTIPYVGKHLPKKRKYPLPR